MKKALSIVMILVTVFALMVPAFADNATGFGKEMWVNCADGYRLNVREHPSTSSKLITRFDCGTKVRILEDVGNGWVYVTNEKISGYVMQKRFVALHTPMNKATGVLLFLLPLTLSLIELKYSAAPVCAVATFAAVQEGHFIRTGGTK